MTVDLTASNQFPFVTVVVSRRNVLALLHKLDMEGSARTLVKDDPTGRLILQVEDDQEHYATRPEGAPGEMHPATETFIQSRT